MTTCDYCGGEHNRDHCPNCGAPARHHASAHEVSRQFKLEMASAMGISAHCFLTDPVARRAVLLASTFPSPPRGAPPRRPKETVTM